MPVDVFEQYAEEYDQWFVHHHDVYRDELYRIQTTIGDFEHPSLEIGVGSGRFAQPLGIPCGLEPSRSAGLMAKGRGIEVIQGRGERMPFPSNTFRTVVMITVLCFLDNPTETIQEVYRILAREGRLIVAFIEREGTIARTYQNHPIKGRFLSLARFYCADEVVRLITPEGFVQISSDCRSGFCIISFQKAALPDMKKK